MAQLTFRRPATASRGRPAPDLEAIGSGSARADTACGPGWFESTWDLWQGLEVREEAANAPLASWEHLFAPRAARGTAAHACAA